MADARARSMDLMVVMIDASFGSAAKTVALGIGLDDDGLDLVYGRYNTGEAHDALQFLSDSSGNFDAGTVTILGMR